VKSSLKFYWNGIKVNGGKLQRAYFWNGPYVNLPADTITITAKDHSGFSAEVAEVFTVQNDSDGMTDYFEKDRIRVYSTHPLYAQVKAALEAYDAHFEKRFAA
jgi:hypothetical protein